MSLSSPDIHPSAVVHPAARIGAGTKVGPFSLIEADVTIGEGCNIQGHSVIRSFSTLGNRVQVFPFACIGGEPQHLKYKGEPTTVVIGNDVVLRENVTVHRGTTIGIGTTTVGDGTFLMAYCHVAHDCIIGKRVIMANAVQCAGHVEIGDGTFIGGASVIAQFCRIGAHCYVGGTSGFNRDCPPFLMGRGSPFRVIGVNVIGLRRAGFSEDAIATIKQVFRIFYVQKTETVSKAIERVTVEMGELPEAQRFLAFVQSSKLGIAR